MKSMIPFWASLLSMIIASFISAWLSRIWRHYASVSQNEPSAVAGRPGIETLKLKLDEASSEEECPSPVFPEQVKKVRFLGNTVHLWLRKERPPKEGEFDLHPTSSKGDKVIDPDRPRRAYLRSQ